jgi:hypothetical protein
LAVASFGFPAGSELAEKDLYRRPIRLAVASFGFPAGSDVTHDGTD